jgi:hypothetical protein
MQLFLCTSTIVGWVFADLTCTHTWNHQVDFLKNLLYSPDSFMYNCTVLTFPLPILEFAKSYTQVLCCSGCYRRWESLLVVEELLKTNCMRCAIVDNSLSSLEMSCRWNHAKDSSNCWKESGFMIKIVRSYWSRVNIVLDSAVLWLHCCTHSRIKANACMYTRLDVCTRLSTTRSSRVLGRCGWNVPTLSS